MEDLPTELNVITLNCWGLLHLSEHRAERLTAIGRELASADPPPHIVALQECWTQEDYRSIRRETRFVLPFGKFYYSGVFGGGLAILSRWPIEESTMFRYPLNGRPTAFFRGDWFVGKGVACARIRYGPGDRDVVEVFNTHTHAIYEHPPDKTDSYLVHRLAQSWEMAKLVRGAAERGHLALALGDFNDVPLSLSYRMLTAHAPIKDAWRVLNPNSSLGSAVHELERARRQPIPSAQYNIVENGVTSNSAYNTWRWSKSEQRALHSGKRPIVIPPDAPDPRGKRIDYIFFSPQVSVTPGSTPGATAAAAAARTSHDTNEASRTKGWVVKDVRVGMLARHPDLGCSLSDHFSVEATLLLHTSTSPNLIPPHSPSRPPSPKKPPQQTQLLRPSSSSSDRSNSHDHAASLLALEHGTYLQSPTGSEYRVGSRLDLRASFDDQLRASPASPSSAARRGDGLPCTTYDEVLALIRTYSSRERTQRRWRMIHFAIWTFVVVACYVAVWFVGNVHPGVAFAFLVLSSVGFLAGAVDGLMGLLFFGGEIRSLAEFEWEIMNAKATASGAHGLAQQQLDDEDDTRGTSAGTGGNEKGW
ncbi:Inositol phosphosphingolipids phospholipase C [Daldinia childiae]|uniref:Inositol phosphosphingolipids phospholipase C n=1 Tax=Daldinia childiae TaxID=326645 RepID=UPI001445C937|nr:Inositol phosphosphingolipids phospholipase C [Daldinia childiae]KAF3064756.1 Inositol phosphosphingolipids phospholipase C [Daldinia childiae]